MAHEWCALDTHLHMPSTYVRLDKATRIPNNQGAKLTHVGWPFRNARHDTTDSSELDHMIRWVIYCMLCIDSGHFSQRVQIGLETFVQLCKRNLFYWSMEERQKNIAPESLKDHCLINKYRYFNCDEQSGKHFVLNFNKFNSRATKWSCIAEK